MHAARLVGSLLRGFIQLEGGGAFAGSSPLAEESWVRALEQLDAVLRTWGSA